MTCLGSNSQRGATDKFVAGFAVRYSPDGRRLILPYGSGVCAGTLIRDTVKVGGVEAWTALRLKFFELT